MNYDTSGYKKHKRPGAWGSPCPDAIDSDGAQALLDTSSQVGSARFNVEDGYCYRAFPHHTDADGGQLWHGQPIPWSRLPTAARKDLIKRERLDATTFRKAIRKGWGQDFSG